MSKIEKEEHLFSNDKWIVSKDNGKGSSTMSKVFDSYDEAVAYRDYLDQIETEENIEANTNTLINQNKEILDICNRINQERIKERISQQKKEWEKMRLELWNRMTDEEKDKAIRSKMEKEQKVEMSFVREYKDKLDWQLKYIIDDIKLFDYIYELKQKLFNIEFIPSETITYYDNHDEIQTIEYGGHGISFNFFEDYDYESKVKFNIEEYVRKNIDNYKNRKIFEIKKIIDENAQLADENYKNKDFFKAENNIYMVKWNYRELSKFVQILRTYYYKLYRLTYNDLKFWENFLQNDNDINDLEIGFFKKNKIIRMKHKFIENNIIAINEIKDISNEILKVLEKNPFSRDTR